MKRALPQYTAPTEFLDEAAAVSARHAAERGDSTVPAAHGPRCVAAREDDYRRQWRRRACLSPPKADPYARLAARTRGPQQPPQEEHARTYRDVMAEHELDVEQAEVERALARKRRDDADADAAAATARAHKTARADAEAEGEGEAEGETGPRWLLAVVKGGATLAQVDLGAAARARGDGTVRFGAAGAGCDVVLAHASCSAHHAKLRMPPADGGAGDEACPRLVDLGSAHGTFVDGERLAPGVYRALHDGAVVTFAHSTRQYLVMRR